MGSVGNKAEGVSSGVAMLQAEMDRAIQARVAETQAQRTEALKQSKYYRGDNIKPSMVTVNADYYTTVVGTPRGTGNWWFFPDRTRDDFDNAIEIRGSYADAKKRAREEAARRGWTNLYVGT